MKKVPTAQLPGPAFIGVGPEKTGTTWIDQQLRQHPDVWLPPIKELRYFWERKHFPNESLLARLNTTASWHRDQYRHYAKYRLKCWLGHPARSLREGYKRLSWDVSYLCSCHDDQWYVSQFENHNEKISGEISPQYFFLPADNIKHISRVAPEAKIIITLRRPLDWVWSFARMNSGGRFLQEKYGNLDAYLDKKIAACSFSKAVTNWRSVYGERQVLILFYDDLCNDPWRYYERICHFLQVEPEFQLKTTISERINQGREQCLPDWCNDKIRDGWRDDILALSQLVPGVPDSWLE